MAYRHSPTRRLYMDKLFVYCDATASRPVVAAFRAKGFRLWPLTDDPAAFWTAIGTVEEGGQLVILSHGNENGFLMVKGDDGPDLTESTLQTFSMLMVLVDAEVYLLSCHSGTGIVEKVLRRNSVKFVAPKGYAEVAANSYTLTIKSLRSQNGSSAGWAANEITPPRHGGMLYFR